MDWLAPSQKIVNRLMDTFGSCSMLLDCGRFNRHEYTNVMDQRGDDLHKKNKVLVLAKKEVTTQPNWVNTFKEICISYVYSYIKARTTGHNCH